VNPEEILYGGGVLGPAWFRRRFNRDDVEAKGEADPDHLADRESLDSVSGASGDDLRDELDELRRRLSAQERADISARLAAGKAKAGTARRARQSKAKAAAARPGRQGKARGHQ
jgi:hypothetical protein